VLVVLALVFALVALVASATGAAAAERATSGSAPSSATVTLVHGVRGLLADIVVDGQTVLKGFAYERASAPMQLPAGTHRVEVFTSGQAHTTPLLDVKLTVKGGQLLTAAVGFAANGDPKAFVFDNRLTAAAHSPSSIVVRNVSQGTAPEVLVDGKAVSGGLAPGAQTIDAVRPGSHLVGLKVGGTWLLTNQPVRASAGHAMVVYIVGRQSAQSVALVADSVVPSTVAAGAVDSGGLPPRQSRPVLPTWLSLALLLTGAVTLGGIGTRRWTRVAVPVPEAVHVP
jgi:hypothetical protein